MASGIARDIQPWLTMYFFDIEYSCLWSIDTCQNKVSRDHIAGTSFDIIKITYFLSRPLTKYWLFIGTWAHVRLLVVDGTGLFGYRVTLTRVKS